MTNNSDRKKYNNFYSGGLAEIVASPTTLTFSFFKFWFTGEKSLGKAMEMLDLPFEKTNLPILDVIEDTLVINLCLEEQTLYKKTIFSYKSQLSLNDTPKLSINKVKIFNPFCWIKTTQILLAQSKWISNPNQVVNKATAIVESIPEDKSLEDIKEIDKYLANKVWPSVIAIGALAEFFNQLIEQEVPKNNLSSVQTYIGKQIAKKDWFFSSLSNQALIKEKKLPFSEYIKNYGLRADKDYEITCPRWHEIQDEIKKRIQSNIATASENNPLKLAFNKKLNHYIETAIELQILRSEAKRKALFGINQLRNAILKKYKKESDIEQLTREQIVDNIVLSNIIHKKLPEIEKKPETSLNSGNGRGVSTGIATGIVKIISSNLDSVPENTICIFPNASPEFAMQYSKCKGIVFLNGGQTSHGAIVAREFSIPALIDIHAKAVENGKKIYINGSDGSWKTESL